MPGYIPGRDDEPASPVDHPTEHRGPCTSCAEPSNDHDKVTPLKRARRQHGMPSATGSTALVDQYGLTEMQNCKKPCDLPDFILASQLCMDFPILKANLLWTGMIDLSDHHLSL